MILQVKYQIDEPQLSHTISNVPMTRSIIELTPKSEKKAASLTQGFSSIQIKNKQTPTQYFNAIIQQHKKRNKITSRGMEQTKTQTELMERLQTFNEENLLMSDQSQNNKENENQSFNINKILKKSNSLQKSKGLQRQRMQRKVSKQFHSRQQRKQGGIRQKIRMGQSSCEDMKGLLQKLIVNAKGTELEEQLKVLDGMLDNVIEGVRISSYERRLMAKNLKKAKSQILYLQMRFRQSAQLNEQIIKLIENQDQHPKFQSELNQQLSNYRKNSSFQQKMHIERLQKNHDFCDDFIGSLKEQFKTIKLQMVAKSHNEEQLVAYVLEYRMMMIFNFLILAFYYHPSKIKQKVSDLQAADQYIRKQFEGKVQTTGALDQSISQFYLLLQTLPIYFQCNVD